jgi:hypothetical protein
LQPPSSRYFSFSDCMAARKSGTFCLASISRCFRSSSTDSSFALLMNVVAIPDLPERPVRPIRCTAKKILTVLRKNSGIFRQNLVPLSRNEELSVLKLKAAIKQIQKFKKKSKQKSLIFQVFKKKMSIATVNIELESCGLDKKLSFDVLYNFTHLSNFAGQRSRSLICS